MYDQSCPTLNQERPRSVKISKRDKLLSETLRQLQGLIKQRVETVVTIFRLANTNLHQQGHQQCYNGRT